MNEESTNANRALWGRNALSVFTSGVYDDDPETMNLDELAQAITDLITNLLHLAERYGIGTRQIQQNATKLFEMNLIAESDHETHPDKR